MKMERNKWREDEQDGEVYEPGMYSASPDNDEDVDSETEIEDKEMECDSEDEDDLLCYNQAKTRSPSKGQEPCH